MDKSASLLAHTLGICCIGPAKDHEQMQSVEMVTGDNGKFSQIKRGAHFIEVQGQGSAEQHAKPHVIFRFFRRP